MRADGQICVISSADGEALRDVVNRSNREAYGDIIHPEHFKDEILDRDGIPELLASMDFYGYRCAGRLVGVAALTEETEGVGRLRWVYVLPEFQRMGVGSALVRHIEEQARSAGYGSICLRTAEGADWAISFYRKLGYVITGRNPRPWGADILMERPLADTDAGRSQPAPR